jgi:hypothetical protein
MFRCSDPQRSLFETSQLLPEEKQERLERDWPGQFRRHALPLIREELFRELYCENNGRPNAALRMVVGVLVLKEMHDLTDEEALGELDYDTRWQVALELRPEEAHCCQKTLHNFRAKLLENGKAQQLFEEMTAGMLKALGLSVERQRLDSTHIVSNIARLTRLRLFCETLRMFLRELKKEKPKKYERVGESLRGRYVKEDGKETDYHDARSEQSRRRMNVAARDVYRLVDRFKGDEEVRGLGSFKILLRLYFEQCELSPRAPAPEEDDADAEEAVVPVKVKESAEVSSASLQTPHDVDVTYSGHKGKGYEVQVSETVGNGQKPELLTHVEVTPACQSDEKATLPVVEALAEREIQPRELLTDTNYASAGNVIACEKEGTEVVAPVRGPAAELPKEGEKTLADFRVEIKDESQPVLCPTGHTPESMERKENGRIVATYARLHCAGCPFRRNCPAQRNPNGTRTLRTTLEEYVLARRRRYESTEEFRRRYAQRAGIEGTNSELKRAHGMGFLRVRGGARVKLAVYLKALACNVKRMVKYLAAQAQKAAELAATGQPAPAEASQRQAGRSAASWRAIQIRRQIWPTTLAA